MEKDILEFIKTCIKNRKIRWTYHINMRLEKRSISRETILSSVDSFEIIEQYPEDKYSPSYLIYSNYQKEILHILIATDFENENIRIITTYKPTLEKWEEDLKTRRKL